MLGVYVTFTNPIKLGFFIDSEVDEELTIEKYEIIPTLKIPVYLECSGSEEDIKDVREDFFDDKLLVLVADRRKHYGVLIDRGDLEVKKSIELAPGNVCNEHAEYWENYVYLVDCAKAEVDYLF